MEQIKNEVVMAKRVLGVLRASTIRQEVESQKKELKDFILSKGYTSSQILWREYKGASARKENDKYKAMIDEVKSIIQSKQIEAVALWHLNRLGRTETSLSMMKEFFEKNKIQVYIKNPNLQLFDVDSQGNKSLNIGTSIAWSIFATMVKFDTEEQFEKTQRGKQYIIEQGKCVSGKAKFGYYVDKEKYIRVDARQAEIIKLIYTKYANEDITARQLSDYLNSNDYHYINEKEFNFRQVYKLLFDETYIGKSKTNSNYPAIIDEELFNKCAVKRHSRNSNVDKARNRKIYLCSKLIKCENCGHSYKPKGDRYEDVGREAYYKAIGKQCHSSSSILIKYADVAMRETFESRYFDYLLNNKKNDKDSLVKDVIKLRSRIDFIQMSIEKLELRKSRINTMYINGNTTDVKYNEAIGKVKEEILEKKRYISELQTQLKYKNEQIQLIENSVNDVEDANALSRKIEEMSNQEVYNLLHSKVKLINSAYVRKIKFQGYKMTAFVIVCNDGAKEIYLFHSYARNTNKSKLCKVFLHSDVVRILEYNEGGVEITSEYIDEYESGFNTSSVIDVSPEDMATLNSLLLPLTSSAL